MGAGGAESAKVVVRQRHFSGSSPEALEARDGRSLSLSTYLFAIPLAAVSSSMLPGRRMRKMGARSLSDLVRMADTFANLRHEAVTALYLSMFLPTIPMPNCYLCAMVLAAAPF
jgi:hypothetical protein